MQRKRFIYVIVILALSAGALYLSRYSSVSDAVQSLERSGATVMEGHALSDVLDVDINGRAYTVIYSRPLRPAELRNALPYLQKIPELDLSLSCKHFGQAEYCLISSLEKVQVLGLAHCDLTVENARKISQMAGLKGLFLVDGAVSTGSFEYLSQMRNLELLSLNLILPAPQADILLRNMPHLRFLLINGENYIRESN